MNVKAMTLSSYRQLWHSTPDEGLLNEVLKCFNLKGLDDHSIVCSCSAGDVGDKMWQLRHKLERHYRPHKYQRYFDGKPSFHRCITILRQVVRLYDHHVDARETTTHPCGRLFSVWSNGQDCRHLRWSPVEKIVTFD